MPSVSSELVGYLHVSMRWKQKPFIVLIFDITTAIYPNLPRFLMGSENAEMMRPQNQTIAVGIQSTPPEGSARISGLICDMGLTIS